MTIDEVPGYQIQRILGVVVGVSARPQNRYTEGVRPLDGDTSSAGEPYLVAGRKEAIARMAYHAQSQGANAVLGMRFDHRVVSSTWVEICAYGTAVVAGPVRSGPPIRLMRSGRGRRAIPPPPEPALYETTMTEEAPS